MRIDLHDGFHLSPIREGDQPAYIQHLADKETTDSLLVVPFPYTQDDADAWVHACLRAAQESAPESQFALRREDGFLIGGAGLVLGSGASAHRADFGYWVAKEYRRRGLGTAGARAMIQYAFDRLGLRRVQATVFSQNVASQRVLVSAGFKCEGFLEAYHIKLGSPVDVYMYGLVRREE